MGPRGRLPADARAAVGDGLMIFDEDEQTILAVYIGKHETTTYRRN